MLTSFAEFAGDKLRARLGSVPGENGQSSAGSEHSDAVEEVESTGEALGSTPLRTADALMQLSTSEDELCRAPEKPSSPSKPSCLQTGLEESFLFLVGEGGDETLHLLASLPRFCFEIIQRKLILEDIDFENNLEDSTKFRFTQRGNLRKIFT